MGQQQLLLLILSAIIVGVAIVMGINMFGENAVQANQDAVTQDVLTIASRAQGWYRRPAQLGGGGRSFDGLTLTAINFADSTDNGSYTVTPNGDSLTIVGTGREDGDGDGTPLSVTINIGADGAGAATVTQ